MVIYWRLAIEKDKQNAIILLTIPQTPRTPLEDPDMLLPGKHIQLPSLFLFLTFAQLIYKCWVIEAIFFRCAIESIFNLQDKSYNLAART